MDRERDAVRASGSTRCHGACATLILVLMVLFTSNVEAQIPLTTRELRRIVGNPKGLAGIQYNRFVGVEFQRAVLMNMPGPKLGFANTKPFVSPLRSRRTSNTILAVIPDGVAGASIGSKNPLGAAITTYPESTFIEVKAVKGKITLAYGKHQIEGMLDVLSRCQAASSTGANRAYPNLYFVTTGDTIIAPDVVQEATRLSILLWTSHVTIHPDDRLQVLSPICVNCMQVLLGPGIQGVVIPGLLFRVRGLLPTLPVPFDPPTLDDGWVGDPGIPGITAPNF